MDWWACGDREDCVDSVPRADGGVGVWDVAVVCVCGVVTSWG